MENKTELDNLRAKLNESTFYRDSMREKWTFKLKLNDIPKEIPWSM
eukprot:CAMPEP_0116923970 /NCGR_PEP_ID=MMETSP0467-20121206/23217_1 /TAXON_ID=283647 /ORGANISM="Mesodinium pulex, Strain SPMC105" /LENGTH=45 /DNA_ID= /DNA_START= /DNA_END= /DNA_ORIENTATION=